MKKRDLFVVVADLDAENAVKTLLTERQEALGIALDFSPFPPPNGDLLRYSGRDSGCYGDAVNLLRPPQKSHRHAIVLAESWAPADDIRRAGGPLKSRVSLLPPPGESRFQKSVAERGTPARSERPKIRVSLENGRKVSPGSLVALFLLMIMEKRTNE